MSKFLAPIHSWLFNKIKLHEELEKNLINGYKEKYGDDILTIAKNAEEKYGALIEDRPIEELIDTSNIHGWLQNKISIAETRQAAFLTEIFNRYGNEAMEISINAYAAQGSECGKDAASKYDLSTAPKIYEALNNYLLNGMPCDNVSSITTREEDTLQWRVGKCLHRGYWEIAGADINTFYDLRDNWIKAFVENANSNFTYAVELFDKSGNPTFMPKITKK